MYHKSAWILWKFQKKVFVNWSNVEPPQAKMSYATMVFVRTAIGQSLTLMIQQYDQSLNHGPSGQRL